MAVLTLAAKREYRKRGQRAERASRSLRQHQWFQQGPGQILGSLAQLLSKRAGREDSGGRRYPGGWQLKPTRHGVDALRRFKHAPAKPSVSVGFFVGTPGTTRAPNFLTQRQIGATAELVLGLISTMTGITRWYVNVTRKTLLYGQPSPIIGLITPIQRI